MTPELFLAVAIEPAMRLLPPIMESDPAIALLIAIALQESRLAYRRQLNGGPAHGFFMFEPGGIAGVLRHARSREHVETVLTVLCYTNLHDRIASCYNIIEDNDLLATVFARLLLWTLPDPLPGRDAADRGYDQYLRAWNPGRPRPDTWVENFATAWAVVME